MIGLASLRWKLTAAFTAVAVFHLVWMPMATPGGQPQVITRRVSGLCHFTMCVAMIVMVWPWSGTIPVAVWLVVFTTSAVWFVLRAARSSRRRVVSAFFATAAAAMVWMGMSTPANASSYGHNHHASMGYTAWISAAMGGYLVLAAAWWAIHGMRLGSLSSPATQAPNWSALCHGVMSGGMGLALLAMA